MIKLIQKKLKFPVVIKPINEGSSVNVFICNKSNIFPKIKLLKDYKKIIIEEFIPGREIQVAIMGNKKLGAIELKPKRKFYDYEAKYKKSAKTKHIIPIKLTNTFLNKILNPLTTNNLNKITFLFAINNSSKKSPVGVIHIHDCIRHAN